jgi:hypothetical protein
MWGKPCGVKNLSPANGMTRTVIAGKVNPMKARS